MLKNILKIVITESQRKRLIKSEKLIKPLEYLWANSSIRQKLNQCLMQILINFKRLANEIQYSHIRNKHVHVDHLFPPVFMVGKDGKTIEELQYSKVALLVFKIFNSFTNRYSIKNTELIKSFFTKEHKKQSNSIPTWFTQFDKDKPPETFVEDSPFLCLLKYILSEEFYSNRSDTTEMLKNCILFVEEIFTSN